MSDSVSPDLSEPGREPHPAPPATRPGVADLFLVFSHIGIVGFGGTLPWAFQILVERRKLVTGKEFVEILALGQILPGANIMNLAAMVGHRFAGYPGSLACVLGLMVLPLAAILTLGLAYKHFGGMPLIQQALDGMSAVTFGLVLGTGVKLALVLPRKFRPLLLVLAGFAGVGLMHLPLLAILLTLGPLGVLLAWRERQ